MCYIYCFVFITENGPVIYTSEKEGSDETGDGSALKPFKTVLQVRMHSV